MNRALLLAQIIVAMGLAVQSNAQEPRGRFDVVVVGANPGGIMAAIAAARGGKSVLLLDRNEHIGGLPANGLGATDIHTRGATAGLFKEFVDRVLAHYVATYGQDSQQVRDCSGGYHFEPSVAEKIFEQMLAEYPGIQVLRRTQFDAAGDNVELERGRLARIRVTDRVSGESRWYAGRVFIDATYEGDLAAAAGAPFRTRREGKDEYNEPLAGRVYKRWGGEVGPGSTGEGDDTIQAYNYRLCLTNRPENRVAIAKPASYDRSEYVSLIDDVRLNRLTGDHRGESAFGGIGRIVNMVKLPNGKTDANNQHLAFISTDLPEENYPWPTADWAWRDRFARRLRDYTLGLLYFAQNDPELPEEFRQQCAQWGLAKDEYVDNGHFPRQVYVREGRRIEGEHLFTAHDAIPVRPGLRPPVYPNSITASHYAIDSHAVRKREEGRVHLDGFLSYRTLPYTVPFGVIIPKEVDGLLTPVPVSGTHLGFSTLRMEPCWMALGQAAGVAAALAIDAGVPPREVEIPALQKELLRQGAVLIYYRDVEPSHPQFGAVQFFGLRGFLPEWEAKPEELVKDDDARNWTEWAGVSAADYRPGVTRRGDLLEALYRAVSALSRERMEQIRANR